VRIQFLVKQSISKIAGSLKMRLPACILWLKQEISAAGWFEIWDLKIEIF